MKVVVTGANGFLGSWLVRALAGRGCDVHALVRPSSDLSELQNTKFTVAHGDVTDEASLRKAFEGADTVFHLAGVIAYKASQRSLMEKVNISGTHHVVEAVAACHVRRLVHLSSVVAIGAGFSPSEVLSETSSFNVEHLHLGYFDTKRDAEKIVAEAVRRGRIDAVILNPSTIYGAGDARKGSRGTQLKVARGKFPFYTEGGVSIIAVEDAIFGILAAWEHGRKGERYILSGENITIKNLFEIIAELAGVEPPKKKMPTPLLYTIGFFGDLLEKLGMKSPLSLENARTSTMYHWFDHSKATRELGLHPRPARDALKASVDWSRENGLLNT